ncbi:5-formyltetrahydrofolate cyclo-ligase [Labrys monachus]|uniref:5-formyltetrahydrofolate cyclo-ligase n=1 Tax=Labrys monachus TaxID=217067 RepID=A0ABU0FDX4_9HYPH|nr:5-formyltetrahydrofolate cyclo-ligase [Labrys monachus]MDQ0392810.1 5,10-methenyltetrahydrofolate synthetase [Labrys monachus]
MSKPDPDDEPREFSSPPCFLHELDGDDRGAPSKPMPRDAVMAWRRTQRTRLIADRLALPAAARSERAARIASHLDALLMDLGGRTVSSYWPLRGEPDLRGWVASIIERGAAHALPVVAERNAPLVFRRWRPGEALVRGFWNIPVPEQDAQTLPDVMLAPVVGFDRQCYRLGYGGGYFDRTLASLPVRPYVVGIGYEQAALETIHPLAHDIPLDVVVTDAAIRYPGGG